MLKKSNNRCLKSISALLTASTLVLATGFSQPALASEPYLGQIETFGFNFAPRGWATCDGQLLQISQYSALFALLGTTFGGDGRTTFGLPDLRGRVAVHVGTGFGLSPVSWGERGGTESRVLTQSQMPSHTHVATLNASNARGDSEYPNDVAGDPPTEFRNLLATKARTKIYKVDPPAVGTNATVPMSSKSITVGHTGGNQPLNIRDPYLGIYHSIALVGVFPSRN